MGEIVSGFRALVSSLGPNSTFLEEIPFSQPFGAEEQKPTLAGPRVMQSRVSSFICVMLLLASVTVVAQQQTKDLSGASLEELGRVTVYTASRRAQKATDASSSVTVISRDEIQK